MAAQAPAQLRPAQTAPKPANWHRRRLLTATIVAVSFIACLAVFGYDYYALDRIARLTSPKHPLLRSTGPVGYRLGVLGGVLFLLIFAYPLRKRWLWLSKQGKTRNWLDFHILMGLAAPAIITFHSAFRLHGVAGLAYWMMMAVVVSGIVGRYLYGQIPRRLDAAEMSFDEIQSTSEQLSAQLSSQHVLSAEDIAPLFRLPWPAEVEELPLLKALWMMILLDLKRPFLMYKLRRKAGTAIRRSAEWKAALLAVRRQTALSKRILFFSKAQHVFRLWHVVHRPFSYSFAILSVLHVTIVLLLGFY